MNEVIQLTELFNNFKKNKDYFEFSFKSSEGKIENLKIRIK